MSAKKKGKKACTHLTILDRVLDVLGDGVVLNGSHGGLSGCEASKVNGNFKKSLEGGSWQLR